MRKVLIIGVDGCRGDTLMKMIGNGECPNIKSICKTYASCSEYSTCGRTHSGPITGKGFMYKTAAGWATIFTGVDNYYHRVKDNEANSVKSFWKISQDKYPTIFDNFFKSFRKYSPISSYGAGYVEFASNNAYSILLGY